eukprot:6479539-Amphidinium_carterae.1
MQKHGTELAELRERVTKLEIQRPPPRTVTTKGLSIMVPRSLLRHRPHQQLSALRASPTPGPVREKGDGCVLHVTGFNWLSVVTQRDGRLC